MPSPPSTRTPRPRSPCSPAAAGTFCAGADLQAAAEGDRHRVATVGPGRWGRPDWSCPSRSSPPSRDSPWPAAWSWPSGATCGWPRPDAAFGVFCRRFGVPLVDGGTVRLPRLIGAGSGPRPDPQRPRGRGGGSVWAWAWSTGWCRPARPWTGPWRGGTSWPHCLRPACAMTACRRWPSGASPPGRGACGTETPLRPRQPGVARRGVGSRAGSPRGPGRHGVRVDPDGA